MRNGLSGQWWVLVILMFLAGCTVNPTSSNRKSLVEMSNAELAQVAEQVAATRWKYLLAKDYDKAFDLYTESSKVGIGPRFLFDYVTGLRVSNAVVKKAQCENSRCEVDFNLTISMRVPRISSIPMDIPLTEVWIIEKDELKFIRPTNR